MAAHDVAALDGADAGRRAGEDQVARPQREQAGEVAIISGTFQIIWSRSPVCRRSPLTSSVIAPAAGWPTALAGCSGPQGADCLEGLRHLPRAAQLLRPVLQVAPGHVDADGVAEDAVERARDRNVRAALAERHHHLDLVMHVLGGRRIGKRAVEDQVVRVLLEEERRLAVRVAAHLDRVGGVVAADAIDAVDREQEVAAGDRQSRLRLRLDRIARAAGLNVHAWLPWGHDRDRPLHAPCHISRCGAIAGIASLVPRSEASGRARRSGICRRHRAAIS